MALQFFSDAASTQSNSGRRIASHGRFDAERFAVAVAIV
jgi:hypothetical protein